MRPTLLDPLFAGITALAGIGPKLEKLYRRLLGRDDEPRIVDLLFHLPAGAIDRRARPKLREVEPGAVVTVKVTVDRHRPAPPGRDRAPHLIYASDETGDLIITYFRARKEYLEKLFPVGETRYVSGTTAFYDGMLQMVHPDRVVDDKGLAALLMIEPVYPLTEGITANMIVKAMDAALGKLPALPEWQDPAFLAKNGFPGFAAALNTMHRPREMDDIAPEGKAHTRLAYDELLASQLALGLMRAHNRKRAGRAHAGDGHLRRASIAAPPSSLTLSQTRALDAIVADLGTPERL
ncbi:MAG: ATP-dependent DNA helicase RecG, partial [Pseudorhodoplanes sp.]